MSARADTAHVTDPRTGVRGSASSRPCFRENFGFPADAASWEGCITSAGQDAGGRALSFTRDLSSLAFLVLREHFRTRSAARSVPRGRPPPCTLVSVIGAAQVSRINCHALHATTRPRFCNPPFRVYSPRGGVCGGPGVATHVQAGLPLLLRVRVPMARGGAAVAPSTVYARGGGASSRCTWACAGGLRGCPAARPGLRRWPLAASQVPAAPSLRPQGCLGRSGRARRAPETPDHHPAP